MAVRQHRSLRLYGPGNVFGRAGKLAMGRCKGKIRGTRKRPQRSPRAKEPSVTPATPVIYLLPPPRAATTITSSVLLLLWLRARRNLPANRQMFSLPWKAVRRARQTMHDNASTFRSRAKATRRSDGKSREMENDVSTGSRTNCALSTSCRSSFNWQSAIYRNHEKVYISNTYLILCFTIVEPGKRNPCRLFFIFDTYWRSINECDTIKWNIYRKSW